MKFHPLLSSLFIINCVKLKPTELLKKAEAAASNHQCCNLEKRRELSRLLLLAQSIRESRYHKIELFFVPSSDKNFLGFFSPRCAAF